MLDRSCGGFAVEQQQQSVGSVGSGLGKGVWRETDGFDRRNSWTWICRPAVGC